MVNSIVKSVDMAILIAIGTFMNNRIVKLMTKIYTEVSIIFPLVSIYIINLKNSSLYLILLQRFNYEYD